ncbi:Head fiber protein [Vagococcus acidifermentans]|uniref:Head fiber protein n=1 Tax=Vagococcus acidifermentans TaxID=564710 RepID=A0A430AZ36_9ENTE|nr:Head fiber protein [Vagococcus acidifermentans]RSU13286.1 Head fiber protein [Vagococcus acidifermentans]
MTYNTKNYTEQGGEKTVIGGTLEIKDEATVVGLSLIENQSKSTATTIEDLVTDFNDLLSKLKTAGLMVDDTP